MRAISSICCWLFLFVAVSAPAVENLPIVQMDTRSAPQDRAPSADRVDWASVRPTYRLLLPKPTTSEIVRKLISADDVHVRLSFGRALSDLGLATPIVVEGERMDLEVRSPGATNLRSGWIVPEDGAHYEIVVAGMFGADVVSGSSRTADTQDKVIWSAVTVGDTQRLIIRRYGAPVPNWRITPFAVSHFDQAITPDTRSIAPKALGDSASCQLDVACIFGLLTPEFDAAALAASRSTALMIVTDGVGSSWTCTGTLLNSANFPSPLFLTAYHCTKDARTLDAVWFFSRSNCGYGTVGASAQTTGGADIVWTSQSLDSTLLRLMQDPPANAAFAGWNANPLSFPTLGLALHHPRGDVKKASLGYAMGSNLTPVSFTGLGTYPTGVFYNVDWQVGIVEPGSSGSGFFTEKFSPYVLQLRGTLTGGTTTCSSTTPRTFYSKFDNVFPYIQGPLTVAAAPPTPTVVEYYHSGFGHYFITAIADEIAKLDAGIFQGWARTGQSFKVFPLGTSGALDVCRFFTVAFAPKSSHFYTPSASECATVKKNASWQYEALVFAFGAPSGTGACPSGTQPLYRLYNNGKSGAPNHRYTTSTSIRSTMISQGFIPEGNGQLGVIGCVPL